MISDLYVQQIKQFKPTAVAADANAVQAFQLPTKPAAPSDEVSADAVAQYEAAEVETASAPTASAPAAEEDWFVFEEDDEHH